MELNYRLLLKNGILGMQISKDSFHFEDIPSIESSNNVFHDLISCVLEQQIHYRSSKNIFQRMLDRSGVKELTPENFNRFEEKAFEGIKLSAKKYETVMNILDFFSSSQISWENLSDKEVRLKLSQIKGIGPWTIDMILIYTLNRPDVFAYDDYHIKKIMISLFELNPKAKLKAQMKDIIEQYSPYKSKAFLYLLSAKNK